ncbi:MAG: AAA family ATPase [Paraburkholderia sp.]|uniref:DnaB-like helicase C-terminal domain-containing protein n=1 Tax=Paraburkholderia sp. TaxID=1926495 RepID=UPI00121E88A8|nr:DnaB-like helicase C-terminal domain-containing protein [Paraburkholderia sp.]TAM02186.1 MAG: AAA family ATPase [Paraburkholderia sp.]TAM28126.1 MAG: AAA family ATPase [Paraburkholderia sp.]
MARTIPDNIDWEAYACAEDDGRADVRPAHEFIDELVEHLYGAEQQQIGVASPWPSVGGDLMFRPGEVSLWGGVNGHGKSAVLGYAMLHAMTAGERTCIASMEMRPRATMERLARQAACNEKPAGGYLQGFGRWTNDRLWIYNHVGTVPRNRMIAVSRYCRKELGVSHMVIDSLLKCGIAPDDYAGQKSFVDELCALARDTDLHIHLVHHARKREKESDVPDKFDLKGAGEITDLVDNVLIVHRNKRKEADLRKTDLSDEKRASIEGQADTVLICAKQRHYTWEGNVRLWFDPASLQFRDDPNAPGRYLDLDSGSWSQVWQR